MKKEKLYNILKVLFIVICATFLLSACSSEDGGGLRAPGEEDDQLVQSQRTCWQGDFLKVFYENIGSMSTKVYQILATQNAMQIVILAFSIWMAYQILRHVSSPTPESIGEFWTKILRKGTLCFVCGMLASSPDSVIYVINTFIFPIYMTILEFTSTILEQIAKDPDANVPGVVVVGSSEDSTICESYGHSINDVGCKISGSVQFSASKFPDEPLKLMSCMACAISDRLSIGYNIAIRVMLDISIISAYLGVFLIAAFTIAKFGFAFYLIDSIFRMNMMIIILPFLIMFYPFEQTRKWSVTGFKIILNSSAIMLCLAILISMSILAMQKMVVDPNSMHSFGDVDEYKNLGTTALSLIFMGFLIIKSSGMAVELSEKVTGGGGEARFQKKMAALIGNIAKAILVICSVGAGKAVTTAIEHSERLRAIAEKIKKTQAKMKKMQQKMNQLAGRGGGQSQSAGEEGEYEE